MIGMDDNKTNPGQMQDVSTPIYQSVPEEDLKPEEVAPEVDTSSGSSVTPPGESDIPPEVPPPVVYENSRSKYFIVIGGVIFFFVVLFFLLKVVLKGGNTKPVTLTYWGLWEDKNIFDPIIASYQRIHPNVKINYEKMDPQDYRDKLLARAKNGQGPDVFRFHNTWIPEIKDVVAPVPRSVMTNADFEKTFYKIFQKDLKIGDFYYGIPLYLDGLVLIYNDSLLKKAGISAPPATWDDLTDDVTRLTVKDTTGTIITAGIALGLASNVDHFSDILGLMIIQNGATLKNLDKDEAAGALESFRKFAEPPNNYWDDTLPNSVTAFAQEKVGMIFAPSWEILTIKSANPDIQLKVAQIPIVPGQNRVSIANYWSEGVSHYSQNQNEAWQFVHYLSEKDTMTKMYEAESKLRLFGEPYSRVDLGTLLVQNQYIGPVIKQADSYVSSPLVAKTYDNGLNDEIIQYLENAINATTQGLAYGDALKTAKLGIDQVFSKYKIE